MEKLLAEADVQLFVIGIIENLDSEGGITRPSPKAKAVKLINTLAQKTGGRAFYAKDVPEMISVVNEIVRDLRTQYVVGYQTSNANHDGKFRKVEVKLSESAKAGGKRTVHARPGYFAPGGKAAEKDESRDRSRRQTSP
ncbi:MAG: Ca-activated chloride channel [Pyrinomonadaceae bacterium]|nr:Ca-activated chloride channel [Pyrinomonadaceae bacterium]